MTLRISIDKRNVWVFKDEKAKKSKLITSFSIPYSMEQFKLWYDISNQMPRKIAFECLITHRKLCMISRKKFEKLNFPKLDYISDLMLGEIEK